MLIENINLKDYNLDNLNMLRNKSWVNDYGFNKAIELAQDPTGSLRGYFQYEKSHKDLWDLCFGVMPSCSEQAGWKYLDLPADTSEFITWVFNKVTGDFFINGKRPEMNEMPYKKLYPVWRYFAYPKERNQEFVPVKL